MAKKSRDELVKEKEEEKKNGDEVEEQASVETADYGDVEGKVGGGNWFAFSTKKVIYARQMDGEFQIGGSVGHAGDWYGVQPDGDPFVLTDKELAEDYVPVSETKRLTHGPVKVQGR